MVGLDEHLDIHEAAYKASFGVDAYNTNKAASLLGGDEENEKEASCIDE